MRARIVRWAKRAGWAFVAFQVSQFLIALIGVSYAAIQHPEALVKFWGMG